MNFPTYNMDSKTMESAVNSVIQLLELGFKLPPHATILVLEKAALHVRHFHKILMLKRSLYRMVANEL